MLSGRLPAIVAWWRGINRYGKAALIAALLLWAWFWFLSPLRLSDAPLSTIVADRNGELLGARIADDGQWRFPHSDTVSDKFAACAVEFEDRYFYWHRGVNPLAVARAVRQNVRSGRIVSGGSTITMQVVRLARGKPRTLYEKAVEALLAAKLEARRSKEEILALYASTAPFGGNVVGMDAAVWRYFGHSPDKLSWAEAATLAVLPNAPSMMHPSKNREALARKRDRLLKRLCDKGVIDLSAYRLALGEPLPSQPLPLPQTAPHMVSLMAQTHHGQYCASTIDLRLQQTLEGILDRWNAEFLRSDIRNIAAIVVEVSTGEVAAYCGNVGFGQGGSADQVDVIRAPRSSGSILKPLLYCAMMQEGGILPGTLMADIPVNINGFAPRNFNMQYDGAVPASQAVARSLNVPSVGMLRQYGIPKFYDFLKKNGINTLSKPPSHYGLSLILGGAEVTLWDICSAYMHIAQTLSAAELTAMNVLSSEQKQISPPGRMPYGRGAVWLTLDAIKEVNRPEEIDWRSIPSMQTIGWKTGTSYGFRDAWAVGITPRYVVGVWVGNSNGEGKAGLTGASTAGPVMFDIFNSLPYSQWFECPQDDLAQAVVCRESGHLAGRFCENTDTILVCPAGMKTEACPYHIQVRLTPDGKHRITADNPGNKEAVTRNWFVLPPAMEWYYRQRHPLYEPLPPMASPGGDEHNPMQFIYPQSGARITLPRGSDAKRSPMVLRVAHSYPDATLYWHMDEQYLGQTHMFHTLPVTPEPGRHTVTVVDDNANTLHISFSVE